MKTAHDVPPRSVTGTSPELSVIVPCHNGVGRLPRTYESIRRQLTSSMELVIVDDVSNDGTAELVASWAGSDPRVRLVRRSTAPQRAAARNEGIAAARGNVVLFLDDDMTLGPGTLATHVQAHAGRDKWAFLGRIQLDFGDRQMGCFQKYLIREERFLEQELAKYATCVPYRLVWTGHFSAKKSDLLEIGGFNEQFTQYGLEDLELGYRLTRSGVKVGYLASALALHRTETASLDTYVARHWHIGAMARVLASLYDDEELRVLLKLQPLPLAVGGVPLGLSLLRLEQRLLLRKDFRRVLGSASGFALLRGLIKALERLGCNRLLFFLYRLAADIRYFQGFFGEPAR